MKCRSRYRNIYLNIVLPSPITMKCVRINPEPFSGTVNERTLGLYSPLCMAKINRNKTRKLFSRKQLRNVLTNCTIFPREIDKLPRKKKRNIFLARMHRRISQLNIKNRLNIRICKHSLRETFSHWPLLQASYMIIATSISIYLLSLFVKSKTKVTFLLKSGAYE